jgi:Tol biopolymer transport system component
VKRRALTLGVVVGLVAGVTLVAASPVSATFPGANGKIAFYSNRSGNNEIYVMNPDGSGVTDITNSPADDKAPAWSADGKHIAFLRTIGGNQDIWVMNADGSGQHQITNLPSKEFSPHFSPDGEKIAFTSDRDGNDEIFVMNADGTNQTQLTFNAADDYGPRFSPDGEKIVFISERTGHPEIFVMDANGSNVRQLTNNTFGDFAPDYTSDGEKIVFTRQFAAGENEIFVMNADGSDPRDLTNNPANSEFAGHSSPDGERIVFVRRFSGTSTDIFVMNADGSAPTNLTNNPVIDQGPDWQPLEVDGDVTVTKTVIGTPASGATYDVKVVCDNGDDTFAKTLTFGEAGGTQSFERESFGPLECEVTEPNTGGASSTAITCTNAKNAECKQNGKFDLFDDPGGDKTKIDVTVTNTFPAAAVTVEPTFTG